MSHIKALAAIDHNFTEGSIPFVDGSGQLTENNSIFNLSSTGFTAGTFVFNIDQTVGIDQDRFSFLYNDSSGEIELTELLISDISGITATIDELNLLDISLQSPLEGRILIADGIGGAAWSVFNLSDANNDEGFVGITGLTNNYIPYWDNGSGTFVDTELQRDSQYNLRLDGANNNEFIRMDSQDGGLTISTDNDPIISLLNYNVGFSTLENSWDISLDNTGEFIIQPSVSQPSGATDVFVVKDSSDVDKFLLNVETGALQLSNYGSQTFAGTAAYWLAIDVSGNLIEMDAPSGGGSSPLTTLGDLFVYATGDTRLPIGTDGQILIVDSTESTGMKWESVTGSTISTGFYYESVGGTTLASGSFTQVPINVEDLLVGNILSFASNEYTFLEAGNYLIIYHLSGDMSSGTRGGLTGKLQIDTGGGYSDIIGSQAYGYSNSTQSSCSISASVVKTIATGDTIRLVGGGIGQTYDTIANGTGISIIKLDTIGLGGAGSTFTGNTGGTVVETDTLIKGIRTISVNTSVDENTDYTILVDSTSNTVDVTLPAATINEGQIFIIKAINLSNTITVNTSGGNIDGSLTYVFSTLNQSITVQSNGTDYYII